MLKDMKRVNRMKKLNNIDDLITLLTILKNSDCGNVKISNLAINVRTDKSSGIDKRITTVKMGSFESMVEHKVETWVGEKL